MLPLAAWAEEITAASFNIRIHSTGNRDDAELELLADRLQQYDLTAIQEARYEVVVPRALAILGSRDEAFEAMVSRPATSHSAGRLL